MLSIKWSATLLVLVFATFLLSPPGKSAELKQKELDRAYFKSLFREITALNSPWPASDIHISNLTTHPGSLQVQEGVVGYKLLSSVKPNRLGRKNFTVAILVNKKPAGEVLLSGNVGLYGNVVCARRQLRRNAILTATDLVSVRRDVTLLGPDVISRPEKAVGQRLTVSLQAGNIIYGRLLDSPPLVKRGDLVTIMANSGNLQITTAGEIKNSGARGDLVKVKNLMSRREIMARVTNSNTVTVDF